MPLPANYGPRHPRRDQLLTDEEGHIDFLETQLDLVAKLGEDKYAQLSTRKMDEAE